MKLPSGVRWNQNGTTVAGMANGTNGTSLNMLNHNFGICYADDDILYIADGNNNRIVLIARNSTTAIGVIGQESQSDMFTFLYPTDVFVTRTAIYVVDTRNYRVQKWSKHLSDPMTVAGIKGVIGDWGSIRMFVDAFNLFVDNYGNLFVSDYGNSQVMKFPWNSTSGANSTIVAGTDKNGKDPDQLNGPSGIFITDDGVLYITDCENHRIQKWIIGAKSGITVAGTGFKGRGLSELNRPFTVLVDLNGYIYITDFGNHRIMRWAPDATVGECLVACTSFPGVDSTYLRGPSSIAFDPSGSLYVSDRDNNRVQKFDIINETGR